MNKIEIACDTTPGTTKDVTITCGDQIVVVDIPDQVFYGVDGRIPDPKYILADILKYIGPALGELQVTSTYANPTLPSPPETKDQISDEDEAVEDKQASLFEYGGKADE